MKTQSLPAMALAVASTLNFSPGAFGHGGAGGGGGHCGGGGHFGGGHGGGCGWRGGGGWRGYGRCGGYYAGDYGGWWDGGFAYPYDDWSYGYPDYGTSVVDYPSPGYSTRSYSALHTGSLVTEVQQRLAQTRYYHGSIDGHIGPRTRNAIGQYQSDHYLPVSGRIDQALLRSLRLLEIAAPDQKHLGKGTRNQDQPRNSL